MENKIYNVEGYFTNCETGEVTLKKIYFKGELDQCKYYVDNLCYGYRCMTGMYEVMESNEYGFTYKDTEGTMVATLKILIND